MEEQNLNFDLMGILRRRLPIALAAAGALFMCAILLAGWLPNKYQASSTLLVEPQTVSKKLVAAGVEESDLNKRLHLMTMQILSRARLSKIIDELGLYEEESESMTREEVILAMRNRIRVVPVLPELLEETRSKNAEIIVNTFRIIFEDKDARISAAVANRLANDFIDEHIKERVQVTSASSEFIENELSRLSSQIQEVAEQIAQVKSENPGSLPEDLATNNRVLERLLTDLRAAQRGLDDLRSDEIFFRQQAASSGQMTDQKTGAAESVTPEHRLRQLELSIGTMRSRGYTEKHPDLMMVQMEIAALKERINSKADLEGLEKEEEEPVKSISQLQMEAQANKAAANIEAAQTEIMRLREEIEGVELRLARTPRVAERLEGLQLDYGHLFGNYQKYANKRLEAKVAAQMERSQKGEQFRVLEAAFPAPKPVSPNRFLILFMGAFLGGLVGAGVAFAAELMDSSFHESRPLQENFGIPVLASVPFVMLDGDRRLQRRRRAQMLLGSMVVVALVCMLSLGGYFYNNGLPGFLKSEEEAAMNQKPPSLLYGFLYSGEES